VQFDKIGYRLPGVAALESQLHACNPARACLPGPSASEVRKQFCFRCAAARPQAGACARSSCIETSRPCSASSSDSSSSASCRLMGLSASTPARS